MSVSECVPVLPDFAEGVEGEALAAGALVHVAQLAGARLARGLARVHAHEHAHVEVDAEAEQRPRVAPVPVGVRLEALQQDSHRELVAALRLERDGSVLGVAGLGAVAGQHRHVRRGDAEQPALGHGLHRAVQEGGGAAVGVEVDHVEPVPGGLVLVHQQRRVPVVRLHQLGDVVVLHVAADALHGLAGPVVSHDGLHTRQLLREPDGAETAGRKSLKNPDATIATRLLFLVNFSLSRLNEVLYNCNCEVPVKLLDRIVENIVQTREENLSRPLLGFMIYKLVESLPQICMHYACI